MTVEILKIETSPYQDQKPGTSGLRKKVTVFQQPNYLGNFIQSLFDTLPKEEYFGKALFIGGDGRYWNREAIQIICEIACGNGVGELLIGQHGWCSTPAASCIIREYEGGRCRGGILLTASHNPGGPKEDFGIKYNCNNGGPAPESITNGIYERSKKITHILKCPLPLINLDKIGIAHENEKFKIQVIDPISTWADCVERIFDFDSIRHLLKHPNFSFVYDGLNGIAGPYAEEILVNRLGAKSASLIACKPLEDFGGEHPDPNRTYAHRLVDIMKINCHETADQSTPAFGGAGDGDNDRNMILGRGFFVTPSDSVAIIAAYANECIPYFKKNPIKGVARSMPTSQALDVVAEAIQCPVYEVPTGWKFFGNLMDKDMCSICGEESFGTGSNHIREKDGLWAVLAWLSILAHRNTNHQSPLVTVKQINTEHWQRYGRHYYLRYDYENVEEEGANQVMDIVNKINPQEIKRNETLSETTREYLAEHHISFVDQFSYKDPVDNSLTQNQGARVVFKDGSRFVVRLSGTGSSGATIRLYLEKYQASYDPSKCPIDTSEALENFVAVALDLSRIEKLTGRSHPNVIT